MSAVQSVTWDEIILGDPSTHKLPVYRLISLEVALLNIPSRCFDGLLSAENPLSSTMGGATSGRKSAES